MKVPEQAVNNRNHIRVIQLSAVDFSIRQFMIPLMTELRRIGYDVGFACSPGTGCADIEAKGFSFYSNYISRAFRIGKHLKSLVTTFLLLRKAKVKILHVHTPIAALLARPMAKLAGVPLVFYTAHGFYFHGRMPWWKKMPHVIVERFGAMFTDFLFTVSAEDEATALRLGIAKDGRVLTIYNGVDTTHFDPNRFSESDRNEMRHQLGIAEAAPVLGIMGRLVREKGFFEYFRAAAEIKKQVPGVRFLIVGDVLPSDYDVAKEDMLACARDLGIAQDLCWAGLVPDPAPYLAVMDVFTLPSYREGMPVSMLEAMSMGLPQIATDIRGCREEVVPEETGWLVPVGDHMALAECAVRLFKNPKLLRTMGEASRRRVLERFDIVKVVAEQIKVYERLAAERFGALD